ncbi:MAG: OmpA family protein [Steroidobacteraceae bacterium]
MRRILTMLVVASALGFAGCASHPAKPAARRQTAAGAGAGASSQGAASGANANAGALGNQQSVPGPTQGLLADRVIHFAFNSSVIGSHGMKVVAAHAAYLVAHPNARVRLEGYTDDRGSPEYNIGLGMRRAESVRQAMLLQGVSPSQITVVSYGEEDPVNPANNRVAWAENRRVHIVYLTPTQPGPAQSAPGSSAQ